MKRTILILTLLITAIFSSNAQGLSDVQKAAAAKKAMYFYTFATKVEWPPSKVTGNFTIGVLGDKALYEQLVKKLSSSKRGSQPIKIVEFSSADKVKDCHILYIAKSNSASINKFSKSKEPILLVTDKSGLLSSGSIVNFLNVRFELSNSNAGRRDLTVGSQLVGFATNVE